jgi:peptidoglycan-associated lipoprotein
MRGVWTRGAVAAVLVLAVVLAGGCKKRGPGADEELGADGAGAGIGERGLGGSSLDRARRGLAPEEDGLLGDVRFGYDSADIDVAGREILARNVQWLRDNPRAKIELEGHADSRGTIEYNLGLGAKRAKTVKDYLVAEGIALERISTISYGKELPLCQEETDACWARNRRVHSVVLGQ